MKILKIYVENFRSLKRVEIEFSDAQEGIENIS